MDKIFSLDIGTRTIVGVVSEYVDDVYKIIDYEVIPHPERAMFDGQIHDIQKVTNTVKKVKDILEKRLDTRFTKVSIAAAGRALKTERILLEREVEFEITKEILNNVEMEGVQLAQKKLTENNSLQTEYYCVGYHVVNYYLDDMLNINPLGHKGNKIKIDLIGTFLPRTVVDSLYTVVDRAGLSVLNLTLEPIAAINIGIPQNLRLLNLALVDVGAGTSDIAITKDGAVVSFGMVSSAGDKFTEELSKKLLMDFDSAEALKKALNTSEEVSYTDILGITHTEKSMDIVEHVREMIDDTTSKIGEKILSFNEKSPSAVFLIGGGGQIPTFKESLAKTLSLAPERVVLKPVETLEKVVYEKEVLKGPEFITPLGIGFTAIKDQENDFLQVLVDEKPVRIFNSKKMSIKDALILIGYNPRALLPKKGKSLEYHLNGEKKIKKGGYGEPARIFLNNVEAHLDETIRNKDVITIEKATVGKDASLNLKDIVKEKTIYINNNSSSDILSFSVNNEEVELDYTVCDGDDIIVNRLATAKDLKEYLKSDILINNKIEEDDYKIKEFDIIHTDRKEESKVETNSTEYKYDLVVNDKPIHISMNRKMIFVDIFDYIDFDLSQSKGKIKLIINGRDAVYTEPINNGDVIDVSWE